MLWCGEGWSGWGRKKNCKLLLQGQESLMQVKVSDSFNSLFYRLYFVKDLLRRFPAASIQ